ncbi:hypothetical protein CGRA01v4_04953 [Colletotrichum graminicola]|uniref:Protein kinase domain-containing protein n=1 Tax=Colletotrichum graminicola (strain M1.001 / M2 / FGSC 10212) TaxID=645133 RepID=E3QEG0_COLGM|nr:uncharacterized protein GLRG_04410 [Colletotrichum graminicola M1.001]EFQ29266.1 hypothetical protein GLRG_04410 [Colletotrichum graminicola M1.001]WDK13672.1 hypothetical protein CGRA01v4_04953 [Colletotrichum graminicola]
MELGSDIIHDIVHPTAAFSEAFQVRANHDGGGGSFQLPPAGWEASQLNPKNRVDSLDHLPDPLWRIDGCTGLGTQFYVIPLFLRCVPPIRIDAFIPEQSSQPYEIRQLLDLDMAFHTKDRARVQELNISKHMLRALQFWTKSLPEPEALFTSVPFGSRIVFKTLALDIRAMEIDVAPTYYLERQLLSASALADMWGTTVQLPECIDIFDVHVVEQIHDSVCLVRIHDRLWILKTLTSYTKYLYHELKLLLSAKPHPNVMSRPARLVTKRCSFGSKIAVVGFTLEYHRHGTMRDIVPLQRIHNTFSPAEQFKWSIQITSGVLHHRKTSGTFYPDLRLDNVVMSKDGDAIMVDFEQRGVWCEFASPEINAIEYIRLLATDEDIPDDVKDKYAEILRRMCPNFEALQNREEYTNPADGYNICWACLSPKEQEAAEVYMLGRVLWCIFEGASAPQQAAVWQSYRWEAEVDFPAYLRTPTKLRSLIDRCTSGRRATLGNQISRDGSRLVFKDCEKMADPGDIRTAAATWWKREIAWAEAFLAMRENSKSTGEWDENHFDRPSLQEVLDELNKLRNEI